MPNSSHLVKCPYFIEEKRKSISCEDAFRTFPKLSKKEAWMKNLCDDNWEVCPYAAALNDAYVRYEEGDLMAIEKNENEALRRELKNMSKSLGRAEKKAERQQKKIDELRAVNASFIKVNENIEAHRKRIYKELQETKKELEKVNAQLANDLLIIATVYEDRLAYMMDTYSGGELKESDVKAWGEGKEFALVGDYDEDAKDRTWKVVFRSEEDEEDGKVLQDNEQK